MITFSILLALAISLLSIVFTFGIGIAVVFGDLIVCGLILWALIKLFQRKKK